MMPGDLKPGFTRENGLSRCGRLERDGVLHGAFGMKTHLHVPPLTGAQNERVSRLRLLDHFSESLRIRDGHFFG